MCVQYNLPDRHVHDGKLILTELVSSVPNHPELGLKADRWLVACQRCRQEVFLLATDGGAQVLRKELCQQNDQERSQHRRADFYSILWLLLHSSLGCSQRTVLGQKFLFFFVWSKNSGLKTKPHRNPSLCPMPRSLCAHCVCVRVSQSSVLHPLLQLVPQLHERRTKRFKVDVCNTNCMLALPLCVGQPFLLVPSGGAL